MTNVEKVIKLFDAAFNVRSIAAKRRYRTRQHFKRGTVFNTALDVLRHGPIFYILSFAFIPDLRSRSEWGGL
jgi:hypothetical protein